MTEFFLPFIIGYGVCRVLTFMLSANHESAELSADSILLRWDNETFAWRPCPISMANNPTSKYMVAVPVSCETVELLKKNSKPSG